MDEILALLLTPEAQDRARPWGSVTFPAQLHQSGLGRPPEALEQAGRTLILGFKHHQIIIRQKVHQSRFSGYPG